MNEFEARKILGEQLARFNDHRHVDLVPLVEARRVEAYEVRGENGTRYQVEIQFFWDDLPGDTIRVAGNIDDEGLHVFVPLTESLLITRPESSST